MRQTEKERLTNLIFLSNEISEVKDLDVLMERVLASAREFAGCDAGSIYCVSDNKLHFTYAQNDTLSSRLSPGEKLIYTTFSMPVTNTSISGFVAQTGEAVNIDDAYVLSPDLPYHFDRSYDDSANYRTRSILTVPLKMNTGRIIGVLQLINAKDGRGVSVPFDRELEPFVQYFANSAGSALERAQLMRQTLLRMISMAELRDPKETGNHVNRVGGFSVEIYEAWARCKGTSPREIDRNRDLLRMAGMLHDVGKVAISDTILKKPGKLTPEEFDTMKQHTVYGARLFGLGSSDFDIACQDVVLNHHERFDGRGYPGYVDVMTGAPTRTDTNGSPLPKQGDEIPVFGRIVALADVYDALSSARSYKDAWTEEQVIEHIASNRGTQFDPEVVDAFMSCLPNLRSLASRYS
jgi:HD-GYP domain-containing protein (c-di-GMP phosphodiesterase class II)